MKKKRIPIRPPDVRADRAQLVRVSRRDLQDLMEEPAPLDNLAALAEALKRAEKRRKL